MTSLAVSLLAGLGATGCVLLVTHSINGKTTAALLSGLVVTLWSLLVGGFLEWLANGNTKPEPPEPPAECGKGKGETFDDEWP